MYCSESGLLIVTLRYLLEIGSEKILWSTSWTEGPGRGFMGVARVGHDLATKPLPPRLNAGSCGTSIQWGWCP